VQGALLAALSLLLALHGLGDAPIVGDDEAREVGIVQDVVRGHVLLPRFNDDLIPDKPILTHWLSALAVAAAGFSETAVRLPSALAGAGLVWWTVAFGTRLLGAPAGLAAGAMLATMPALFTRARLARSDAVMLLLLALALGYAWRWWRDGNGRAATLAWAWLGLATFAKGPVAPALGGTAFGLFLLWQRDWRRALGIVTPAGLLAFAVLGAGWYAVALAGWGDEFVQQHLVGRYVRNLAGGLPRGGAYSSNPLLYHLTFYPLHLPAILLPWTPLAAVALWEIWRGRGFGDPRARFLVCWLVAPVVVFTPAEWKLRYYLLPALPAAALLAAPTAVRLFGTLRESPSPTRHSTWLGIAVALLVLAAAAVVLGWPQVLARSDRATLEALLAVAGGRRGAAAGAGLVAGIAAVTVACRAWGATVALLGAGSALWLALGAPALEASTASRDTFRDFGREVAARVPADRPLVFYGEPVRSIVVYVGRPIPSIRRRPERLPPDGWVLAFEPAYRALAQAGLVGPPLVRATGRIGNLGRGEVVLAEVRSAGARAGPIIAAAVTARRGGGRGGPRARRAAGRGAPAPRRRRPAPGPTCPASSRTTASSAGPRDRRTRRPRSTRGSPRPRRGPAATWRAATGGWPAGTQASR